MPLGTRGSGNVAARIIILCVLIIARSGMVHAQISPGELSAAHAQLEGIAKCTSCHSLGKAVSSTNCLNCHKEVASRIGARKGLHATYVGRECVECHKEHHGRDFSIVHFDPGKFDHRQTGYVLEGKHAGLLCEKCHTAAHITAADIKGNATLMRSKTYLGLATDCLSCHADEHRGQLSRDCVRCHSMAGWKPATRFDHARARFALTGKHVTVECGKCHKPMKGPGTPVQFAHLEFARCSSCHGDPHNGRFIKPCESCHTTAGWREGAARSFDHALTRFALRGKHATVRCEQCHGSANVRPAAGTQSGFHIAKFSQCDDCHKDPHRGQFTTDPKTPTCASCHTETGWKLGKAASFDHSSTRFPLRGKHAAVTCDRCHGNQETLPRPARAGRVDVKKFAHCADCHPDPHRGQFERRPDRGACEPCHTENAFSPSLFTALEHEKSRFPLTGAHRAIACVSCHKPPARGDTAATVFVHAGEVRCTECHEDIHRKKFEGTQTSDCTGCHSTDRWRIMVFAHDRTRFPLTGKHVGLSCASCHTDRRQPADTALVHWKFRDTPSRCVDCHPQDTTGRNN